MQSIAAAPVAPATPARTTGSELAPACTGDGCDTSPRPAAPSPSAPAASAPSPPRAVKLSIADMPLSIGDVMYNNPSRIRPEVAYAGAYTSEDTSHESLATPPRVVNGHTVPLATWLSQLSSDPATKIRQISQMAGSNQLTYQTIIREVPTEFWAQNGGECDCYAVWELYCMVASGALGAGDIKAYTVQSYSDGGWHTVPTFRDPATGHWNIMNYGQIIRTNSLTAVGAIKAWFANNEMSVFLKYKGPPSATALPKIAFLAEGDHRAAMNGVSMAPMLSHAIQPTYGVQRGLMTPDGPSRPNLSLRTASIDNQGFYVTTPVAGASVQAIGRTDPVAGSARAGLAVLVPAGRDGQNLAGGKFLYLSEPGGGESIYAGGEWWHIGANSYVGVTVGGEVRIGVHSETMEDVPLTTLGPMVGVAAGKQWTIAGRSGGPASLQVFVNGGLHLGIGFATDKAAQDKIKQEANGNTSLVNTGSLIGNVDGNMNLGIRGRLELAPQLSLNASVTGFYQAMDPTLLGRSTAMTLLTLSGMYGVEGDVHATYDTGKLKVVLGASSMPVFIFDRDVVGRGYGEARGWVNKWLGFGAMATGGLYGDGETFGLASGQMYVDVPKLKTTFNFWGGVTAQAPDTKSAGVVAPMGGVSAKLLF